MVLVGRKPLLDAISTSGLFFEGLHGARTGVDVNRLELRETAEALQHCEIVLVTVKSGQTQEAGQLLAPVIKKDTLVVSFQNGLQNTRTLLAALPNHNVLAGIVPFNVVWDSPAVFKQGTGGALLVQDTQGLANPLKDLLESAGLATQLAPQIESLQWGKLLMNLNNAINALSGRPLQEQLSGRDYRLCLAASQSEAIALLKRANINVASPLAVPLGWLPYLLRLPTPLFRRVARAMLQVGPEARSSMSDDLQRGRKTEIDFLNGEVVALAARTGEEAPINAAIVRRVKQAEEAGTGSPNLSGPSLRAALGLS